MAYAGVEKAFCVLQFAKCESVVMVQCQLYIKWHKDPPTDETILYLIGCLSAGKRTGWPRVSDVDVDCVRDLFAQTCKSQQNAQQRNCRFAENCLACPT
ncbi:hypothetical protein C0J52_21696 [Blattella germanica]|nr:hypothetical protein C0J52_21696 [Blattella germanica]